MTRPSRNVRCPAMCQRQLGAHSSRRACAQSIYRLTPYPDSADSSGSRRARRSRSRGGRPRTPSAACRAKALGALASRSMRCILAAMSPCGGVFVIGHDKSRRRTRKSRRLEGAAAWRSVTIRERSRCLADQRHWVDGVVRHIRLAARVSHRRKGASDPPSRGASRLDGVGKLIAAVAAEDVDALAVRRDRTPRSRDVG